MGAKKQPDSEAGKIPEVVDGAEISWFAKRARGGLPESY